MNDVIDKALEYRKKGLSVIPINGPKMIGTQTDEINNKCKQPLISWKEYQTKLPTEEEITSWFTAYPEANIAIVTGKKSGIFVFDLDSKDAVEYFKSKGSFPDTPIVKTAKGYHIYMKYPDFNIGCKSNRYLGIDVKGDGGYVIAPPSVHGSGCQYEWEGGKSIFDLDPADCSPWMIGFLSSDSKSEMLGEKKKVSPKSSNRFKAEVDYEELLKNGCQEGERNYFATTLIGHLIKKNNPNEAWEIISMWNQKKPPTIGRK